MGHRPVGVEVVEDRPRGERAEDQLEPELLGQRHHPDQEDERPAHANLGARVLQADERGRDPAGALGLGDGDRHGRDREHEQADQDQLRVEAAGLTGEEQREQQDRGEVSDRGRGDHQLAEGRAGLARVGEHRDDDSQRGRCEDHGDQERLVGDARQVECQAGCDREREGHGEAQRGRAQEPSAQRGEIDLEARQEQQERKADQGEDLDRVVDLDPAEDGGADHDPDHDLERPRPAAAGSAPARARTAPRSPPRRRSGDSGTRAPPRRVSDAEGPSVTDPCLGRSALLEAQGLAAAASSSAVL